ncbi:MAG TPA: hypothetical protein VGK74_14170 [Symbiobacteriaceae bacterium]|jgi:hypothetical protein
MKRFGMEKWFTALSAIIRHDLPLLIPIEWLLAAHFPDRRFVGGNARVRGESAPTAAIMLAPQPLAGIAAPRQFGERFAADERISN